MHHRQDGNHRARTDGSGVPDQIWFLGKISARGSLRGGFFCGRPSRCRWVFHLQNLSRAIWLNSQVALSPLELLLVGSSTPAMVGHIPLPAIVGVQLSGLWTALR